MAFIRVENMLFNLDKVVSIDYYESEKGKKFSVVADLHSSYFPKKVTLYEGDEREAKEFFDKLTQVILETRQLIWNADKPAKL